MIWRIGHSLHGRGRSPVTVMWPMVTLAILLTDRTDIRNPFETDSNEDFSLREMENVEVKQWDKRNSFCAYLMSGRRRNG